MAVRFLFCSLPVRCRAPFEVNLLNNNLESKCLICMRVHVHVCAQSAGDRIA